MAAYATGDVLEVTINNPVVGSFTVYVKAGEESTFNTGGFRAVDDNNMIDGSGAMINQLTRNRWSFECTVGWDMNERTDIEKLSSVSGSPAESDITISSINGIVYGGKGTVVGDLMGSNKGTIPVKFSGGGVLAQL
jgi:hypothetical protein